MGNQQEIIYTNNCELCDSHKTDLGTLKELEKTVKENFPDWLRAEQVNLIIAWFEQTKLDARMHYIEASKQKTTAQIQAYKVKNIKSINGG